MKDQTKTKAQLIEELAALRQTVAGLRQHVAGLAAVANEYQPAEVGLPLSEEQFHQFILSINDHVYVT